MSAFSRLLSVAFVIFAFTSSASEAGDGDKVRTDVYGDPLPPGAVARLGSVRFQHGSMDIGALAFSPDGKSLASAGEKQVILWDRATGKQLRQFPIGNWYRIALGFTADGKVVALGTTSSSGENDTIKAFLLRPETSEKELPVPLDEDCWLGALAFSADGKRFLAAGDKTIALWDAVTRKKVLGFPIGKQGISAVALSPDYRLAACVDADKQGIYLLDLRTQQTLRQWRSLFSKNTRRLAFSRDGKTLIAAETQGIRTWDMATGKELRSFGRESEFHFFGALAVSPDGKALATANGFATAITRWDIDTGKEMRPDVGTWYLRALTYIDRKTIATISDSGVACFWDAESGKCLRQVRAEGDCPGFYAVSRRGKLLAGRTAPGRFGVWDVAAGKARWWIDPPVTELSQFNPPSPVDFLFDGRMLMAQGRKQKHSSVHYWDSASAKVLSPVPSKLWTELLRVSADGTTAAFKNEHAYDVQLFRVHVHRPWQRLGLPITLTYDQRLLDLSPDGRRLLVTEDYEKKRLGLVDAAAGDGIHWFDSETEKLDSCKAVFSPDGQWVASTHFDGTVRLWDVAARKEVERFVGHDVLGNRVVFSPDGQFIASEGYDHNVLIWKRHPPRQRSEPKQPAVVDVDALWRDLASPKAEPAQRAVRQLAIVPQQAVAYLKRNLPPVRKGDARRFPSLIADLDSDRFAVREKASRELTAEGESAEEALEQSLEDKPSLELRQRVLQILDTVETARRQRSPDNLRTIRAVQVLELIGNTEARQVLKNLSEGAGGALRTQEARAALRRMAK